SRPATNCKSRGHVEKVGFVPVTTRWRRDDHAVTRCYWGQEVRDKDIGKLSIDFGTKRQNSFDVTNPAGSSRIDGNPDRSDRIEIGAGLQSLLTAT
ncbi:hypothetical protein AVEN_212247-2-1, partial [Araneus ventricosus]